MMDARVEPAHDNVRCQENKMPEIYVYAVEGRTVDQKRGLMQDITAETQAAIERFEHERRMPVTGQISERLLRELAAVIGHPVD